MKKLVSKKSFCDHFFSPHLLFLSFYNKKRSSFFEVCFKHVSFLIFMHLFLFVFAGRHYKIMVGFSSLLGFVCAEVIIFPTY